MSFFYFPSALLFLGGTTTGQRMSMTKIKHSCCFIFLCWPYQNTSCYPAHACSLCTLYSPHYDSPVSVVFIHCASWLLFTGKAVQDKSSYLTLSVLLVIDYQQENVIVVKVTSPLVYMLSLVWPWCCGTGPQSQCCSVSHLGSDTRGF